jgi:hypothetical protein
MRPVADGSAVSTASAMRWPRAEVYASEGMRVHTGRGHLALRRGSFAASRWLGQGGRTEARSSMSRKSASSCDQGDARDVGGRRDREVHRPAPRLPTPLADRGGEPAPLASDGGVDRERIERRLDDAEAQGADRASGPRRPRRAADADGRGWTVIRRQRGRGVLRRPLSHVRTEKTGAMGARPSGRPAYGSRVMRPFAPHPRWGRALEVHILSPR